MITPFLPGDSLLFATGALAAMGSLNLAALVACYITASTLGDAVNYAGGLVAGARCWPGGMGGVGCLGGLICCTDAADEPPTGNPVNYACMHACMQVGGT